MRELDNIPGERLDMALIAAKKLAKQTGDQVHFRLYADFVVAADSNLTAMWCLAVWTKRKRIGPKTPYYKRRFRAMPPSWTVPGDRELWSSIIRKLDRH